MYSVTYRGKTFADWGSLTYAINEAYLALLFYKLTGNFDALNFGMSNVDFMLGTHSNTDNSIPENLSFLIGYDELNGSFPQYPHHAGAFGYGNNAWDLFSQEEENPGTISYNYQLTGALVGGPKSECGNYNEVNTPKLLNKTKNASVKINRLIRKDKS